MPSASSVSTRSDAAYAGSTTTVSPVSKSRPESSCRKYRRSVMAFRLCGGGFKSHQTGGAALVEVHHIGAGSQEVTERLETQRLFGNRRVHPLHLRLDRRIVQPVGVVLLLADPQGSLQ